MTDFIFTRLFPEILNMSLTGSIVILAVLVIRFFLRKAPKKWSYLLWLVVAFRLICPVSLPSPVSLLGAVHAPVTTQGTIEYIPQTIVRPQTPTVSPVIPSPTPSTSNAVTPNITTPVPQPPAAPKPVSVTDILPVIWLIGMAVVLIYSVASYLRLRRRLTEAILYHDNVWQSDKVHSPFILGLFRPRIYIPFGLDEQTMRYVLAHEHCHLRRKDHIIKPLAFLLLTLHWFNPLCWLAFHLMGRDMEMSCDEQVLAQEDGDRKVYSTALLSFAANRRFPAPSPLAFGEGEVRPRITNALNWKAPKVWVTAAAGVLCVVVLLLCAFNPKSAEQESTGRYTDVQEYIDFLLNPIAFTTIGDDVTPIAVTDAKAETLKKMGEVADLSPNGVLEVWDFSYLLALDEDPEVIAALLSEGQYEKDGWYNLFGTSHLIVLRYEDGSCDVLGYGDSNMDFPGTLSYEEALHEWYLNEYRIATSSPLDSIPHWHIKEFDLPFTSPPESGPYASMEDYITAVLAERTQLTLLTTEDDILTAPVTDRKVVHLEKYGELSDLAPEGTLEVWGYDYALKLDVDPDRVELVGGNSLTQDGWFSSFHYSCNVVALLDAEGSYTILYDEPNNDGFDFWGGRTPEEAIHDWYVKAYDLTDTYPLYMTEWTDLTLGFSSTLPVRRYDIGDFGYIYFPENTWLPVPASPAPQWRSAYETGARFSIGSSTDSLAQQLRLAQAEGLVVTNEGRCYRIDYNEPLSVFVYPYLDGERTLSVSVSWPAAPSENPYHPSPEQEKEELFKIARSFGFYNATPTSPETLRFAAEQAASDWLWDLTATDTVIGVTVHRAEYDEEMTQNVLKASDSLMEGTYACVQVEYSVCCDDAHPVAFSFSHPFPDGSGRYTGLMSLTRDNASEPWQYSSMPSTETLELFCSVPPTEGEWTRMRGNTPEEAVRATLDAEAKKSFVSSLTVDSIQLDQTLLTYGNIKGLNRSELAQIMGWDGWYLDTNYAAVMARYTIRHKEPWNRMDGTYQTLFHLLRDESSGTWILMEPLSTRGVTIQDNPELEQALTAMIQEHYAPEQPDGLYHTQSYTVVDMLDYKRTAPSWVGWYRHLYTVVLNQSYDLSGGTPRLVDESHSMDMITVTYTEADHYKLVSYRTPTQAEFDSDPFDTSTFVSDKGVSAAGNLSQYYPEQNQLCYEKALAYKNSRL